MITATSASGLVLVAAIVAYAGPRGKRRLVSSSRSTRSTTPATYSAPGGFALMALLSSVISITATLSQEFETMLVIRFSWFVALLASLLFLLLHIQAQVYVGYVCPPLDTKKLRIAFFVEPSPFAHISGLGSRYCNSFRCLRALGHEVMVLMPEDGFDYSDQSSSNRERTYGAKVVTLPSFRPFFYRDTNYTLTMGLSPRAIAAVSEFKPDLIHATSPGFIALGATVTSSLLGVPLVLAYHTHVPHYVPVYFPGRLMKLVAYTLVYASLRLFHNLVATITLCTSSVVRDELVENGLDRVYLWERGVDTEVFSPKHRSDASRARLLGRSKEEHALAKSNKKSHVLLYVGRLAPEKNIPLLKDILLSVVSKLTGNNDEEVVLSIVGGGPSRAMLLDHFKNVPELSKGRARVVFTGELQGDDLSGAYASADLFSFASETETLGFVVFEAMASGLPVVAPRAGGIPDLIKHEQSGFLFKPGDVENAADLICTLLSSESLRQKVASTARVESERWGWPVATRNLVSSLYLSQILTPSSSSSSSSSSSVNNDNKPKTE